MSRYYGCVLWFGLAMSLAGNGHAQGMCRPTALGSPCWQGGSSIAASNEPGLNAGVGNPIHLISGNKYQQEHDLPASAARPLHIVRHYNSLDRRTSALGRGWALSYDSRLFQANGHWQITQADGSRIQFAAAGTAPQANRHGTLRAIAGEWVWVWPTGKKLVFDASGRLVGIEFAHGARVVIGRHKQAGPLFGLIATVTDDSGAALSFGYKIHDRRAYLIHIDSPAGRFEYGYETVSTQASSRAQSAWQLARLTRPDGMQRRYLYEPRHQAGHPFHLTGITIVSADTSRKKRINTWVYDSQGRAIRSIAGGPQSAKAKLSIDYVRPPGPAHNGITIVTNARGHKTHFSSAIRGGRPVLLRVSGAACPGCAAPGSRASYDDQGRLSGINSTLVTRTASGSIKSVQPAMAGWPGLIVHYSAQGLRASWDSSLTGTERMVYNQRRQPIQRIFASGDRWQYRYDTQGLPIEIVHINKRATEKTVLRWQGHLPTYIQHPRQTESRRYDERGRLSQRTIVRPANGGLDRAPAGPDRVAARQPPGAPGPLGDTLRYTESFRYDDENRLIQHDLPEGGALHYEWGRGNRLTGIQWHDRHGAVHTVIQTRAKHAGYRYGNGLDLRVSLIDRQAGRLVVGNEHGAIWTQALTYDARGLLRDERHRVPLENHVTHWRYAYNTNAGLIGAQGPQQAPRPSAPDDSGNVSPSHKTPGESTGKGLVWYAWRNDGSLAARRVDGKTIKPAIKRDDSGLPKTAHGFSLRYGPNRRLIQLRRNGVVLDRYGHNAFGQRIFKQSPRAQTHYLYLNNRLVAESRHNRTQSPGTQKSAITRRYIYAHHVLVGLIDYPAASDNALDRAATGSAQLYAVHSDLIGAPRLITDSRQKIRWLASYGPTGAATQIAGDLRLDLRLPGQIFDATTGWHDNLLRTYLPESGHYLEPDPIGPVPGAQALGYARQQPRRYIDPLGLMLFAFDGTGNTPQTQTNVWKMSQHYQGGPVFYHSGPGSGDALDWDTVSAHSAPTIIETQWQALLSELAALPANPANTIPIDIIGFSRGAALARHFGNLIDSRVRQGYFSYADTLRGTITACLDLRFMGLFDTVAQFGLLGTDNANYDLSIAPAWEWVAHAVALQERRWLFPLTAAADNLGQNTIEVPFIGAHSDIGGGVSKDDDGHRSTRGDLADVALNWMLWQARAASLQFDTMDALDREISEPVLHDQRATLLRAVQNGDRRIDAADGSLLHNYQDDHPELGRQQRDTTETLITRHENWRRSATAEVGTVDMHGYAQWLHDELGWRDLG